MGGGGGGVEVAMTAGHAPSHEQIYHFIALMSSARECRGRGQGAFIRDGTSRMRG